MTRPLAVWLGLKGCKVQPGFQFSPALKEWESVGIWLRTLGNAAYVACLPLFCQGSKWLNGKSVWLVFRRSWVRISARFFPVDLFLTLSTKNIIRLEDVGWFSFSIMAACHCYLNTIVGSHKSLTSWIEIARPIKNHMNHCNSVVASNYSQCPEHYALIHYAYHLLPCLNPSPNNKRHFIKKSDFFSTTKNSSQVSNVLHLVVCCVGWVNSFWVHFLWEFPSCWNVMPARKVCICIIIVPGRLCIGDNRTVENA